jgi:hypothetical protein
MWGGYGLTSGNTHAEVLRNIWLDRAGLDASECLNMISLAAGSTFYPHSHSRFHFSAASSHSASVACTRGPLGWLATSVTRSDLRFQPSMFFT